MIIEVAKLERDEKIRFLGNWTLLFFFFSIFIVVVVFPLILRKSVTRKYVGVRSLALLTGHNGNCRTQKLVKRLSVGRLTA